MSSIKRIRRGSLVTLPSQTIRVPPTTGFRSLTAQARFNPNTSKLSVVITGVKAPANQGPGLHLRNSVPWVRKMNADGTLPRVLKGVLGKIKKKLLARKLFPVELRVGKCNTTDAPLEDFLASTCASCVCWYCTLSS